MDKKKQVLGRGLGALIPAARASAPAETPAQPAPGEVVREVPVGEIDANPFQTRTEVDEKSIAELADSIKAQGILQPIVLRYIPGGRLQLVAGQRRLLASQRAGKATVPAIVRQLSDEQAIELTIVENLQREDLNPMDQALAFEKLSEHCGLTQEQIAAKTGKERATISNYVRLLKLPSQVRDAIRSKALSMGHARALMALSHANEQIEVWYRIRDNDLTVREAETLVAQWNRPRPKKVREVPRKDPNVKEAEQWLLARTGCKVDIDDKNSKGKVTFYYKNLEDFERICEFFEVKMRSQEEVDAAQQEMDKNL
jgi:ParB family transcriptional regulator, chromosome partitioning protein